MLVKVLIFFLRHFNEFDNKTYKTLIISLGIRYNLTKTLQYL